MAETNRCIYPGELLIPADQGGFDEWACVACDQFTSEKEYWEGVKLFVGDKPSASKVILPECYLDETEQRIPAIQQTMRDYLNAGVLSPAVGCGFVLTERNTHSGARVGLVCLLDLECYDFHKGAKTLVRASEATIESRIPPRMQIRRGAAMELSHVLMLMDDPMHSVIEPLYEKRFRLKKVYDFPLMMNGGQLTGYAVTDKADIESIYAALDLLRSRLDPSDPLLFAVGDGNHSLATAKSCWEEIKRGLTPEQTMTHPARFAMVELENIHDDALRFEPIHRVLFGYDGDDFLDELEQMAAAEGTSLAAVEGQDVICLYEGKEVTLRLDAKEGTLVVGTLQNVLDRWLAAHPDVKIDYIHDEAAVRKMAAGKNVIGFLLPAPEKDRLFETVRKDGALPRKTFSMGSASEKRYYMEARRLL